MPTSRYHAYLKSLPPVFELPGGWRLERSDDDLCGFEVQDTRYPLVGLCGLMRHDIAGFAAAMNKPAVLLAPYRRELEACVRALAAKDPPSPVLLSARALLAEQP